MGSCVSKKIPNNNQNSNPGALSSPIKSNDTSENQQGLYIPEFPYFNRSEGRVYLVQSEDLIPVSFGNVKPFALESALCVLKTGSILAIGGLLKDELVKEVNLLDIKSITIKDCAPLPAASKLGQAHQIDDWVYYIGGIRSSALNLVEQSPLMRYNIKENTWQSLFIEGEQFGFNRLRSMGTCVLAGKIIIIGGHRINSQNEMRNNKTIYSIDPNAGFRIKAEAKIPFKVSQPLISSSNNWAVVAGGVNSKNFQSNRLSCLIEFNGNEFVVSRVQDTFINLIEKYPTFNNGNLAVMVQYPHIKIFSYKEKNWVCVEILGKNTRKVTDIKTKISVGYEDLSSDDSALIGKMKEFKRMETKEGELLRSVFRKKVDQEGIEDKKNGGVEERKFEIDAKNLDGMMDKEGELGIDAKVEEAKGNRDGEVKENIKIGNGLHEKDSEIDSDLDSNKSSSSSSSGESSSSDSSSSTSNKSSPSPFALKQESLSQIPKSNLPLQVPAPIPLHHPHPHTLPLPPVPPVPQVLPVPPPKSVIPMPPVPNSNIPSTLNIPKLPAQLPLPQLPFKSPPVLLTAMPESDSEIEEIQIKKSPNLPTQNLEARLEDPVVSFSANIDIQPEILRVSTPKIEKPPAVPELKLRPNTTENNSKLKFRGKLKPLIIKEFKPYLASKTFRGTLNYLRSPTNQEAFKTLRSVYLSPEHKDQFKKDFDDVKTSRINLFGASPTLIKPDTKIKISYTKMFPEENVQKLSNLILTELEKPCKLVPVIDSYLSLKVFLLENLGDTLITIENFNHVLIGITLVLGKKAFTKKQISYISSKSQLAQNQSNLSHDQFCLGVYKAYKVALLKKN